MCNNSTLSKLIKKWMRWVLGKLNFPAFVILLVLWGRESGVFISYMIITCVCVPRGTQKLMLISASLRPCVQHTTPVPAPPSPSNTHLNPDAVRHRRHASPLWDFCGHRCCRTCSANWREMLQDRRHAHSSHLHCSEINFVQCAQFVSDTSMTECWIQISRS